MNNNETITRGASGLAYVCIMWFGTSFSQLSFSILFAFILILCLYEMWKLRLGKSKFLAFLYILIPLCIVQLFGSTDHNYQNILFDPSLILFMFILTWTFDTFAYLTGTKFGNNKILPKISPNKSWEGFAGGWISTVIVCYLVIKFTALSINIENFNPYLFAIVLPITASLGDFLESYYKRQAGVKDSGNFIPGHGGMLDRIDAFTITIPILYLYINLI